MVRILQRLFALLTVISMQTVYTKQVGKNFELYFTIVSMLFLLSLIVIKYNEVSISKDMFNVMFFSNTLLFCTLGFRLFFAMDINLKANVSIVLLFTIFFDLILIYFSTGKSSILLFIKDTSLVIFILAVISLFFFIFAQNLGIISPNKTIQIVWGGNQEISSWFGIHFNPQGSSYNGFIHGRNTGIFVEPPQYAFMLCYALISELFINKKKSIIRVLILLVTIYTTVSTTGIIVTLLSLGAKLYIYKPKNKFLKYLKWFLSPLLVILLFLMIFGIYKEKMNFGNSAAIRSNNNKVAWMNFLKSPLIGMGFKSDALGIGGGNTSTLTQVLQEGGLLFFVYYFYPFLKSFLYFCKRKRVSLVLFISLYFVLLIPTVMTYTQFSVVMVAIMYSYYKFQKA